MTTEREILDQYVGRALAHGITVSAATKDLGPNLMVNVEKGGKVQMMNLTRLGDLINAHDNAAAVEQWIKNGGTVKNFDAAVAGGLVKSKYVKNSSRGGGRKATPIETGDAKFDMYLNALPAPVRVLVVPLGLDPRVLYKEYRELKKDGIIAKYDTEANRTAAGITA